MDYILQGLKEGILLLFKLDKELYRIIFLSVAVSSTATALSSFLAIPIGVYLGIKRFRLKGLFSRILYTFMSIPSVVVGLLVAISLSRRGPLGSLQLLYTPTAMIIAQTILVFPLALGLVYNLSKNRGKEIEKIGLTLGARRFDVIILIVRELKIYLFINVITVFSRAISEVGAVMIVGGNIKGHTRVITTSIAMFNSMGSYSRAIALGLVLLLISFLINSIIYSYNKED
ncbi:ABC transporter permease [Sporosalibacterium faouarense]|uniref:ABC transporter permease n=1 Tax=Sporosalibacterium faouarense TaxID=516123 RepID=UPI00192AC8FF|nr:ABC transporter permease [Sporosalibacterium faouarense]